MAESDVQSHTLHFLV